MIKPNQLKYCHPWLAERVTLLDANIIAHGLAVSWMFERTAQTQLAYYAQGRNTLEEVNRLRRIARQAPITAKENEKCITWTLASLHIIDILDNRTDNDLCLAADFTLIREGQAHWNTKISVNDNEIPDYTEIGILAENLGFEWGGRWKSPDYPHIQVPKQYRG